MKFTAFSPIDFTAGIIVGLFVGFFYGFVLSL